MNRLFPSSVRENEIMREIPGIEFKERIKKVQVKIADAGLDAIIVHANESDFAYVRYLSDFWSVFETAGVIVPKQGEPILLVGPESETFAASRSKIKKIRRMYEYRESADPECPGMSFSSFRKVFDEAMEGKEIKKLGISGYLVMSLQVYESIKKSLPGAEIIKADDIIVSLRSIKSNNEIVLMREAYRISELALESVLKKIKPGMTEFQVVGIAQEVMYRNGAEYEGHPQYVLSGRSSADGISRPSHKKIKKNEMIQLDIGARVGGYSSSVGRPICIGKMQSDMKKLVEVGLSAHWKTIEWMKPGVPAKEVVKKYYKFIEDKGYGKNILYGPCHGIGLIEVEQPWMELTSNYKLAPGMTFQVDTFLYTKDYGLRWENGVVITEKGVEILSKKNMKILEV